MTIDKLMRSNRNIDFLRVDNSGKLITIQTRYTNPAEVIELFDRAKDYDFSFAWVSASAVLIKVRGIKSPSDNMFNGL